MDPRSNKFHHWNASSGYYDKPSISINPYKTEKELTTKFNINDLKKSLTVALNQREYNKNQIILKDNTSNNLPKISSKTLYIKDFIYQKAWKILIENINNIDRWQQIFNEYIIDKPNDYNQGQLYEERMKTDQYINKNDVERIVIKCLGDETPDFIIDKFLILSQNKSIERKIYWDDFKVIIDEVIKAISYEVDNTADTPGLIKLMMKPKMIYDEMGPVNDMSTLYRDTFSYHANQRSNDKLKLLKTYPHTATEDYLEKFDMDPSSKILNAGTTKGTFQLPGFSGHIPMNKRNARKVEHSIGLHTKPFLNNLLITQKSVGCLSGYSGYISTNAPPNITRLTGCDPRTSTGAAYGPVRYML